MKPGYTGLKRLCFATGYSIKGLIAAWQHEAAIRQETILLLAGTVVAIILPVSQTERILLIASLVILLITELLNSAVEAVVDRISPEHHELSGRAKDIGSAAVFVCLLGTAALWLTLLLPLVY
ncbi:diacylglycerol kinase [Aliamphritea spongicola]|uniref:diacylglycerol kinase n=1 Tax=Aliamphritea spongicola TaxID=707589 RepID=UPI00196B0ECB|nr:diacylglycerol kinase [Aliamphritea spongicola]MBN3564449.1 diacylglycerol kinase [Aliamphritea spongicola]